MLETLSLEAWKRTLVFRRTLMRRAFMQRDKNIGWKSCRWKLGSEPITQHSDLIQTPEASRFGTRALQ